MNTTNGWQKQIYHMQKRQFKIAFEMKPIKERAKSHFQHLKHIPAITVVPWTSSHILYSLLLHQKSNVSKATC